MTSLVPGPLFAAPGLNQHSTPTHPTATPSEIDRRLGRVPFNGRAWPRESPIARVYDVANTSTSMVLLNKRRKKRSQLRGLTDRNGEIMGPQPDRHEPVNWPPRRERVAPLNESHTFVPKINLDLGWVNATQRPPVKFDHGSHVDHKRHTSCRVNPDRPVVNMRDVGKRPLTSSALGVESDVRNLGPMLNDPDLTPGERRYLYSIARIYSTSQMKALKQDQYYQLLFKEISKGYKAPKEYERYLTYLNTPRKTQHGKLDNYDDIMRSRSAPPPAEPDPMQGRGGESEKTPKKKMAPLSSRSWANSMVSSRMSTASLLRTPTPQTRSRTSGSVTSSRKTLGSRGSKRSSRRESSPPPSEQAPSKAETEEEKPVESAPVTVVDDDDDDDLTLHTRKDEDDKEEAEVLEPIKESGELSYRSKDSGGQKAAPLEEKPATPREEKDGVTPRKDDEGPSPRNDVLSPRKGEEEGPSPRKDLNDSQAPSDGQPAPSEAVSSSHTGGPATNAFLELVVSEAEKEDSEAKTDTSDAGADKRSTEEDRAGNQSLDVRDGAAADKEEEERDASDTAPATGHTPRQGKEGRTRPLSRAGRPGAEVKDRKEHENSDDDYDDTDDECTKPALRGDDKEEEKKEVKTEEKKEEKAEEKVEENKEEKADEKKEEEPAPKSAEEPEAPRADETQDPVVDTSRTDDSKDGRGDEANDSTARADQRAASPEEGRDERAEDSVDAKSRSVIIPITQRFTNDDTSGPVLDLSSETRNKDVDKIQY